MRCDVCGNHEGVSVVSGVLREAESAGVRRLCAVCNIRAARHIQRLGMFKPEDEDEHYRRREFASWLKGEKARRQREKEKIHA